MASSDARDKTRRQFLKSAVLSGAGLAAGRIPGLSAATTPRQPLTLVKGGESTYSICISQAASPSEKHAAEELQRFLQEISGARLPVVTDADKPGGSLVLVGNSTLVEPFVSKIEKLGPEGFVLRTAGDRVLIVGGRERGTLYGVYTFLEKLGCRWFTRDVSVIPKKSTLFVEPLDEIEKPAFEYREPYFTEACDKDWPPATR